MLLLIACSDDSRYDQAAKDYCDCVQPLMDASVDAMQQLESGTAVDDAQRAFQRNMKNLQICLQDMQQKYADQESDANFKTEVQQRVVKLCPGPEGFLKDG